jgi:cob(I)alamin adenosyltransferase
MAHRISRVVTRTGDDGATGLADGSRCPKHDPRIHALGEMDELNSQIGLLRVETLPTDIDALLDVVQQRLFDLGVELAVPGRAVLDAADLERLDAAIAHYNAELPPLREFVLPGGCRAAALTHVARTVCRRAERALAALPEARTPHALPWLNRLSDLLFVLARVLNRAASVAEAQWQPKGGEWEVGSRE